MCLSFLYLSLQICSDIAIVWTYLWSTLLNIVFISINVQIYRIKLIYFKIKSLQYRIIIALVLFFFPLYLPLCCVHGAYMLQIKKKALQQKHHFDDSHSTSTSEFKPIVRKILLIFFSGLFSYLPCSTRHQRWRPNPFQMAWLFLGKSEIRVAWQQIERARGGVWAGADDSKKKKQGISLSRLHHWWAVSAVCLFFIHPLLSLLCS